MVMVIVLWDQLMLFKDCRTLFKVHAFNWCFVNVLVLGGILMAICIVDLSERSTFRICSSVPYQQTIKLSVKYLATYTHILLLIDLWFISDEQNCYFWYIFQEAYLAMKNPLQRMRLSTRSTESTTRKTYWGAPHSTTTHAACRQKMPLRPPWTVSTIFRLSW